MSIKKKIISPPYDKAAEENYYKEAKVCPNCETDLNVISFYPHFTCKKCGCEWKVKLYKRRAKWNKETQ